MKIIELARCIDNKDPLGIGRVRVEFIETLNAPRQNATDYTPWDSIDPFMFYPFLPAQINIVPQENQIVKVIFWNIENTTQSREYLAGPFINAYDFSSQGADKQLQATSRGVRIKKDKHLFRPENGSLIDPKTKGVVIDPQDMGLYGKYGTDIIFTRNGVNIRAGKLDDSQFYKTGSPAAYNQPARIFVKKFDQTLSVEEKQETTQELQHKPLNTIVEYEVYGLEGFNTTFNGVVRTYKITHQIYGLSDTQNFNQNKNIDDRYKSLIQEQSFSGLTLSQMGRDISQTLRSIDQTDTQAELNAAFFGTPTHPFYYKPSLAFYNSLTGATAISNAKELFNYVSLGSTKAFGLAYSQVEKDVPSKSVTKTIPLEKYANEPVTMGGMMSQLLFLLSYDANVPNDADKINFASIDNYEPTQEQLLREVLPKTFSHVRGEPLLELLALMVQWMISHVHNPAESGIGPQGLKEALLEELHQATEKILNQKVRSN